MEVEDKEVKNDWHTPELRKIEVRDATQVAYGPNLDGQDGEFNPSTAPR